MSAFGFRYAHENPFSYEFSCGVCSRVTSEEDLDAMILCEGGCKRIFHMDCIGLSALPDGAASKWACTRCIQRLRSCHICCGVEPLSRSNSMMRCSVSHCGKYFHKECFKTRYGEMSDDGVCPLHRCGRDDCTAPINDECYFCIYCLKAFHLRCMPEEIEVICENTCVCLDHHLAVRGVNSGATFKDRLLQVQLGRQSVKRRGVMKISEDELSVPSTVCSPDHLATDGPESIRKYIASHYMIPYKVPISVSDEHIILSDDDELVATTRPKEGPIDESGLNFVRLRTNEWVCARPRRYGRNGDGEDGGVGSLCDCVGEDCGMDCPNRQCFIQCDSGNCRPTRLKEKSGEKDSKSFKCGNKPFGKGGNKSDGKYKVVSAGGKGMGMVAKRSIEPHEFIVEYIGEVLSVDDWGERQRSEPPGSSKHFYVMDLDGDHVVDASRKGNDSRLINHSCDPNLETQKWTVNGESRIGLFAIRPITKGEELTFNYQFETFSSKPFKCLCGTAKCTGWIGGRAKKTADNGSSGTSAVDRKRNKAEVLPLAMLEALASVDIRIAGTRTDGTRKKEDEIALEEISACKQKIDYFLQYIWAGPVSGEAWIQGGRKCHTLHPDENSRSGFNPAALLALSVTKIEAAYIKERHLMLLRQLRKARLDLARRFYVWPETTKAIERVLETNWISDDCCVRCRRTGNLLWCKTCVRSFHQCCVGYGDIFKSESSTFTCRRCKRLSDVNRETGSCLVPPIRMPKKDRATYWLDRRSSYWTHWVLPGLTNRSL